jgi:hypothetical protein
MTKQGREQLQQNRRLAQFNASIIVGFGSAFQVSSIKFRHIVHESQLGLKHGDGLELKQQVLRITQLLHRAFMFP